MSAPKVITRELLEAIRRGYVLRWHGIHGKPHWDRVCANGLRLAPHTGADSVVVELFAYLHDARRWNDGGDRQHGPRAADLARSLHRRGVLDLSGDRLAQLAEACADHTRGRKHTDPTIATCWDADRLDLWRVGIRPDPRHLCTDLARDPAVIAWAMERSRP